MSTVNAGWRGPNIVKEGLVLYLDAASGTSYSPYTSGVTWRDISGNGNNGTLTNGPSYSSANGGSIVFDGVDDYINLDAYANNLIFNSPASIAIWLRPLINKNSYGAIFQIGDGVSSTLPSTGSSFVISYGNTTGALVSETFVLINYVNGDSSATTTLYGVENGTEYQNTWVNICAVISANTWTFYINGVNTTLTKGSFWDGTTFGYGNNITNKSVVSIGCTRQRVIVQGPIQANIATTQIYNKALSATEVLQNYNSAKSRFNL
jgi:hypothetical protein